MDFRLYWCNIIKVRMDSPIKVVSIKPYLSKYSRIMFEWFLNDLGCVSWSVSHNFANESIRVSNSACVGVLSNKGPFNFIRDNFKT